MLISPGCPVMIGVKASYFQTALETCQTSEFGADVGDEGDGREVEGMTGWTVSEHSAHTEQGDGLRVQISYML